MLAYLWKAYQEYKRQQKYIKNKVKYLPPNKDMNSYMYEKGYEIAVLEDGSKRPITIYIENGVQTIIQEHRYQSDDKHAWSGGAMIRYYHRTDREDKKGRIIFTFDPMEDR